MKLSLLILTIFISLLSSPLIAVTEIAPLPSTQWQKVNLEKEITEKVRNKLTPVIPDERFLVEVQIEVTPPAKPQFTISQNDLDKKKEQLKKLNEKQKIKINDYVPDELPKDYILFSKLGLEAPLIEDILQYEIEKIQNQKYRPDDKDNKKELAPIELPKLEQQWKYNESLDIFKNLESINVLIKVNSEMNDTQKQELQKIINGFNLIYGDIKASVKLEFFNFLTKKEVTTTQKYLSYLEKFSNIVAAIVGVTLLGIFGLLMMRKLENLNFGQPGGQASTSTGAFTLQNEESEDKDDSNSTPAPQAGEEADSNAMEFVGIKRFKSYFLNNTQMATTLLKIWIKSDSNESKLALKALVQQLDTDELQDIFSLIDEDSREKWKSKLDSPLDKSNLIRANKFISNEIVSDIIVPHLIVDPELRELILDINTSQALRIIKQNEQLGPALIQVLSPQMIESILYKMDSDDAEALLATSATLNHKSLQASLMQIKSALQKTNTTEKLNVIIPKLKTLMKSANSTLEGTIFKTLSKNLDREQFLEFSTRHFPSDLIQDLPTELISDTLKSKSTEEKASFIYSLDESQYDFFYDAIAPVGSKARDIIELEMERINSTPEVQASINDEKSALWSEFIHDIRNTINNNSSLSKLAKELISSWELTPSNDSDIKSLNEQNADLKIAS